MKIAITGALGHIGSKLIRELPIFFPKANILMIDNLSTNRFSSLYNLPTLGNYKFIEGNVNSINLYSILKGSDFVINLAAITDAASSFERKKDFLNNNYNATKKIASACIEIGARLIVISSTSVYGQQEGEVSENSPEALLKPQSPYAEVKLKEEKLIRELVKKNLKSVTLRFGTIFGISQGMRFHTAVNKFCWQAVMNQDLTIWETAYDQQRPYLDLNDAVNVLVFFIQNKYFDGEIYNVLTNNFSVKNVVDVIRESVPKLNIKFVENKIMNQLSYRVLSTKIQNKGFIFKGDLRSGIKDTINLLKNSNNNFN